MSEIQDLTEDTLARLTPDQMIALLRGLDPADEAVAGLDVDVLGRVVDPAKLGDQALADLLTEVARLADGGARLDLGRMAPRTFARLVGRASQRQVEAVTARPELRARVLDEVFRRMETHFRADRAGSTRAVVHFRLTGAPGEDGYDRYEVVIEDGRCAITKGHTRQARATITLAPAEFLRLATGVASAPVLFMTGKVRVRGDLGFAAGFLGLFDIPRA
ncbi:SCP-2 sterol transfer family protein [Streptoalloteichus tenebrarius]|uniref:SCP-2 sterol transfer family protein n=1 Tax=Streptoalloteichus tenebrarius (strain ATCC 17920 / DSM 40477 / JCM 4838 / CBS 697.72 / NBRC 16177 / NCIMB 11028 / NRRL B-12390 / A12253. 1 / ISP 5477) TaxID=1933 RepID=A0ABT1I215_STRSD|nr:SCP2 sterol-binding domain-containing protein [Streptoalloteichus tenebrarius]MCP2261804.1 SCP-2 sterol transfer family protein [Streptoalloteichus tenebrarius]BFF02182.1 SCP2 sterol-binding domain-containing protein [Streptoalloteichus tenebrarius]